MSDRKRIALIHATRLSMAPIDDAAEQLWPEAEFVSILDEGLSVDRAAKTQSVTALNARIVNLARYAETLDPDGILYTCSAFGEGIEQAAGSSRLPVLKPNEAMFEEAISLGDRAVMIYTFPASVDGMEREFREEAARRGSEATIRSVLAEGARPALVDGNAAAHNTIIAETVRGITDADVILLAHFSMARARQEAQAATKTPVLTSPDSAVRHMRARLHQD